jgi:hypothetical protein
VDAYERGDRQSSERTQLHGLAFGYGMTCLRIIA